jgi:CheY-like chemotaxis protein
MKKAGAVSVLLVDDDEEWRQCMADTLQGRFTVCTASSAAEGLKLAAANPPSVIVLDVMMPGGMDGFRAFAELAKGTRTRHIPVIFLSSINGLMDTRFAPETLRRHLGAAPAAFLEKPVDPARLAAEILRVAHPAAGRGERRDGAPGRATRAE